MTGNSEPHVDYGPALLYDADCGFCAASARWLTSSGSAKAVAAQEVDLTDDERVAAGRAAGWLVEGQVVLWGAPAIAESLVARGGASALAGRVMRRPVIRLAADLFYRAVAANRHLMPGSTAACRVADTRPRTRVWVPAVTFLAVTALWMTGIAVKSDLGEPYPALVMPAFPGVPESDGVVTSPELELQAIFADGDREPIDFRELFPETPVQIDSIASSAFSDPARNRDPETVAWVRERLTRLQSERKPVGLEVTWWSVQYAAGDEVKRTLAHFEVVALHDE